MRPKNVKELSVAKVTNVQLAPSPPTRMGQNPAQPAQMSATHALQLLAAKVVLMGITLVPQPALLALHNA